MDKEVQEKIAQLQMIEQNMQQFHMQRQTIQVQLVELDNALEELSKTKEEPYKVVGNIMVACKKDELQKDLTTKKETCELRLKNVEKQETQLKEKMESIHSTIMQQIEKKEDK
jgi:prefoldin beta subunit|tara:strand:- start:63613 stop:63951 length:339 start_codon:yes stop_codon:yes gene_type:complete